MDQACQDLEQVMEQQQEWLIETRALTKVYGDGEEIRALDNVNLHVTLGEFVAIMGPSGSGKSTLLNLIGALDRPTQGEIYINGQDMSKIHDLDSFRSKTVGFVFQMHNLIPTMTARENIEIPMMGHKGSRDRTKRAEELLGMVGMADRMKHLPSQLSGGQRQRVAVARALANHPPLVLADEPTGNLDTVTGLELMNLLRDLNQTQGTTFVIVTHDPAVARQTRRVLVMEDGHIVREDIIGSPIEEDLKMWRHSGLGRRLLDGDEALVKKLDLTSQQLKALQNVLD